MGNPWFRLYHEFATDPKVQMMSEVDQRRLIMLFCLRCCNGCETLQDNEITFQLRIRNEEWQETKAIFIDRGFIDKDNKILNWSKRQYVSDSSTARVKKFREIKKKTEKKKRKRNVSVTPPDTDTETDIKQSKPFRLPSDEEINEGAEPKILQDIKNITENIYRAGIWDKVHAFVNTKHKQGKNDRAILHTLTRYYTQATNFKIKGNPWGYCERILQIENGNFNEKDYIKNQG